MEAHVQIVKRGAPIDRAVRVGVMNNFNCTDAEWAQLDEFAKEDPRSLYFINSNIKTPSLISINNHPYQAVITANPDLFVNWRHTEVLENIDPSKVAFVRVKWMPDHPFIDLLIKTLSDRGHNVVITLQRFLGMKTLRKYTNPKYYANTGRYRLTPDARKVIELTANNLKGVYICDRRGLGCQSCNLCSRLVTGKVAPVVSLNLSTSGACTFNCPDCFARACQKRTKGKIHFDDTYQNKKQKKKEVVA